MFANGGHVEFEQRDTLTTSSNINTVPTDILPQWVIAYAQANVLRDVATVFTTHDVREADRQADRVVVLAGGIAEAG